MAGFRLTPERPISHNETTWIEFLRLASSDSDPAPTLHLVQAMRRVFEEGGRECRTSGPTSSRP